MGSTVLTIYYNSSYILYEYFMESNMLRYFYITFPMMTENISPSKWKCNTWFARIKNIMYTYWVWSKSLEFNGFYDFESLINHTKQQVCYNLYINVRVWNVLEKSGCIWKSYLGIATNLTSNTSLYLKVIK